MPLISTVLRTAIEAQLRIEFSSLATKTSLRTKLDGGGLNGALTDAKNVYKAMGNIKDKTQAILNNTPDIAGAPAASEDLVKRVTANEWANALTDAVSEWMSDTIAPIIADIIASEVDSYIKSATIIVPPGQVVSAPPPAGVGATTAPSPPANIT